MMNREPEFMTWKRRGAERVRRLVEGMSREEELEFWHKRTEDMRARQKAKPPGLPQSDTRGDPPVSPPVTDKDPRRSASDNVIREPECVTIKRRGAERVRRLVEGMSREEELEFWHKRTEQHARPPRGESVKSSANSRRQSHNLTGHPIRAAIAEHFILPVDVLVRTPERLAVEKMLLLLLRAPSRIKNS